MLGYQLYRLNIKVEQRAKEQYNTWIKKDYEYIKREQKEIAQREARAYASEEIDIKARDKYEQWRQDEVHKIVLEQKEFAKQEAIFLLNQWKEEITQKTREDAIQKSKSVIVGKITEHFVPYLPDFTFSPKDARFIGSPVDLVVFDGLDDENLRDIWFIEVKTGSSRLSKRQKQIKEAVQDSRVKWLEIKKEISL